MGSKYHQDLYCFIFSIVDVAVCILDTANTAVICFIHLTIGAVLRERERERERERNMKSSGMLLCNAIGNGIVTGLTPLPTVSFTAAAVLFALERKERATQ
eukprot:15346392-Ditylum_brightwellii.AAC.1